MNHRSLLGLPDNVAAATLPGERVYWVGSADTTLRYRLSRLPRLFLGWPGAVVAVLLLWDALPTSFTFGLGLLPLGVALARIMMVFWAGSRVWRLWKLRRTTYLLTQSRALVVCGAAVSSNLATEGPSRVSIGRDGRHVTMEFGEVPERWVGGRPVRSWRTAVTFEAVTDVSGLMNASRRVTTQRRTVQDL